MNTLTAWMLSFLVVSVATARDPSSWTIHIDFEGGAPDQMAQGPGAFSEAFSSTYSRDSAFEGRQSSKMRVSAGSDGWGEWGAIQHLPGHPREGDELWFRVAAYFPPTFNHAASPRLKFLRIHTMSDRRGNEGYIDLYILPNGRLSHDNEILNTVTADLGTPLQKGKWETYEMYVKFSSVPGRGKLRLWQNGDLIHENASWKTLLTDASYSDRVHLFTYWNGGAPQSQAMLIDDVVITTRMPASRDARGNPMIGPRAYRTGKER